MTLNECRQTMERERLRAVFADEEKILYVSSGRGMEPMLEFLRLQEKNGWRPVYQADRIIGKAAIIVAHHCGVREIYGDVVSESAMQIAERCGIRISWGQLVPMILNRDKTAEGPFEAALSGLTENDFDQVMEIAVKVAEKMRRRRGSEADGQGEKED